MLQHYSGSKVRQVPVRLNLPEAGLLWAAHSTLVALSDDRRQISAASAKCAPATPIRPKSPHDLARVSEFDSRPVTPVYCDQPTKAGSSHFSKALQKR